MEEKFLATHDPEGFNRWACDVLKDTPLKDGFKYLEPHLREIFDEASA
jgi:hypothetical protein